MAAQALDISIGAAAAAPKQSFTLMLEVDDEPVVGEEDTTTTHHVLKFHPKDVTNAGQGDNTSPGLWSDNTNTWLFKKPGPPPLSDAEKKKREKMAKKGEMVEEKDDKDAWKRPWLITHEEDTDFEPKFTPQGKYDQHVFEARREGDKRSKNDKLCNVTLTKIEVIVLKVEEGEHRRSYLENLRKENNAKLQRIYKKAQAEKKRLKAPDIKYKVSEFVSLLHAADLEALEALKDEEKDIVKKFCIDEKGNLGKGPVDKSVDINGSTVSWSTVRDSEGPKGYTYFWIEMNTKAGKGMATVRPVQGDWWNVRKDAGKRGLKVEDGGEVVGAARSRGRIQKKEDDNKSQAPANPTRQRLLERGKKDDDERAVKQEGYGDEGSMKQQWRNNEEEHGSDDEMDQAQCGDIDDDDHDQKLALNGDDVAVDPQRLQQEREEEEMPDIKVDSEDEEEDDEELDDAGKEMKRIRDGKPKKDKDNEEGKGKEGSSEDEQPAADDGDKGDTRKKESKKKPEKIILKIPNPSGAAKPASSLGKRSTAEAGASASASAGPAAAKKVKTEGDDPQRERLEEQVRQVMKADSEMCVRKLMDELKIKKQSKEMQTLFSEIVKKLCVATKNLVQTEGPYQGQKIIKLKTN